MENKFTLPLKDWLGIATTLVLVTASYFMTNANQDKNSAIMNTKLDAVIMNQQAISSDIGQIKIALNNHEVRITVLEKTTVPLLSQADIKHGD